MAVSYDVAVAALAIDVPPKWIDNLLSRHQLPGVQQTRQGVTRRLSRESLQTIALVRILCEDLHVPTAKAVEMAAHLTTSGDNTLLLNEGTLTLSFDQHRIAAAIAQRLPDAMEATPRRPRGRRPRAR